MGWTTKACSTTGIEQASCFTLGSSGPGSRRQKPPELRQPFLNRLPDPHGQRSFLPSRSSSSFPPWTTRTPRFTFVSNGKPLRRLLIVSKRGLVVDVLQLHDPPPFPDKMNGGERRGRDTVRQQGSEESDHGAEDEGVLGLRLTVLLPSGVSATGGGAEGGRHE